MLLNILLVILVLDCVALTAVILMQRSEGGALHQDHRSERDAVEDQDHQKDIQ